MLKNTAEHAARDGNDEQPHQHARERAAEVKSTVKKNDWQGEKAEPEEDAHPGLRAADAPRGDAFTRAKKRRENDEAETDEAENQAHGAAAARSLRRFECIADVNPNRNAQNCRL